MSIPNKPYKSYEERLEIIRQKNVYIEDEDVAINILKNVSYYELINGYKDIFMDDSLDLEDGEDYFTDGVSFESIYLLFLINNTLHSLILDNLLLIERRLKTIVSDVVSDEHGITEEKYFHPSNYNNTNGKRKYLINQLNYAYYKNKPKSSIAHYKQNHNHIPPWILITEFSFYDTIIWYSCLKGEEKSQVCKEILPNPSDIEKDKELLVEMLHLTRKYRNGIAHGKRTFASQIDTSLPKVALRERLPNGVLSAEEFKSGLGSNDIFAVFISIILILGENTLISLFLNRLESLLQFDLEIHPEKTIYEILEIPADTIERLKLLAVSK